MSEQWGVNSDHSLETFITHVRSEYKKKKYLNIKVASTKTRSNPQNASIRLYWSLMAEAMNDAGFSYIEFIRIMQAKGVEVPWDGNKFGDTVWRSVQAAMFPETILKGGHCSTTKLKSHEVTAVYDVVNRKIIEMTNGLHVMFPNKDG